MSSSGNAQFVRFIQQECSRLKEENQALTDEVRALRRYVGALREFQETIQHFTREQDVLALLDETMECALELLDADDGSFILVDEETDELIFVLVHGSVREALQGYRFDRRQGIAGWVADYAEPVIVGNVKADSRFLPEIDERFGFETCSLVAVPLVARGRVLGVIEVVNKRSGEDFTEEDVSSLSILATLAACALDYTASAPVEGEE
jgi:signal transduction protein with GAF and PtsI domain